MPVTNLDTRPLEFPLALLAVNCETSFPVMLRNNFLRKKLAHAETLFILWILWNCETMK